MWPRVETLQLRQIHRSHQRYLRKCPCCFRTGPDTGIARRCHCSGDIWGTCVSLAESLEPLSLKRERLQRSITYRWIWPFVIGYTQVKPPQHTRSHLSQPTPGQSCPKKDNQLQPTSASRLQNLVQHTLTRDLWPISAIDEESIQNVCRLEKQ